MDENGHQSKNKHVVTSDSSQSIRNYLPSTEYSIKNTTNLQSIRNYLPSTEYSIKNTKIPNTRDNRQVHNRGYYDTNW